MDDIAKKLVKGTMSDKEAYNEIGKKFGKDNYMFKKAIDRVKYRAEDELLKKNVSDPFFLDLKREKNVDIQALLLFDKFGDVKDNPKAMIEVEKAFNASREVRAIADNTYPQNVVRFVDFNDYLKTMKND